MLGLQVTNTGTILVDLVVVFVYKYQKNGNYKLHLMPKLHCDKNWCYISLVVGPGSELPSAFLSFRLRRHTTTTRTTRRTPKTTTTAIKASRVPERKENVNTMHE